MGKSKAEKPAPVRSALERFEVCQVHRSELKGAPYNPRTITTAARRKLRKAIEKLGMLGPITWNRRTGNIVGGHQRISISDQLSGTKDYLVTVAAVELTDAQEREANLLLNNAAATGDFEIEKLEALLKFPGLDLDSTGWEAADVMRLFGSLGNEDQAALSAEADKVNEATLKELERYDANIAKARERDSDDFYMVVIFRSYAERLAWTKARGLDDNRYQSAEDITASLAPGDSVPAE